MDYFTRVLGENPPSGPLLKAAKLETPLGPMLAIGDDKALFLLEFLDLRDLSSYMEPIRRQNVVIVPGESSSITQIKSELQAYFSKKLTSFNTPLSTTGTPFQIQVWEELKCIPYGETRSYADVAATLGKPSHFRAVARANATNRFAILIPCHRVINANGGIGGYGGGLVRKEWLLRHEKKLTG